MTQENFEELNVDERRARILAILNQEGKVKVAELSKLFGISEVTIRTDLSELENAGMLERVHGGAVSTYRPYYNMTLHDRAKTNVDEKKRIAQEVASMISDGDTVIVTSGTTTLFVVQELKNLKNLTIITNSVSVSQELGNYRNANVILLGGNFNPQYQYTYGEDTICQLKRYKADKLILSADGIDCEEGITICHHFEAEVNRQMIARVNKIIVAADYTKIGRTDFAYIDSVDSMDILVTNENANHKEIGELIKRGIEVRTV